nr:UDP-N-acetylmuramoyl-tripeptide--D-alanyl-D-alanine ligase [Lachnobacterium bovis]
MSDMELLIDGHKIEECRMKHMTLKNIAAACNGTLFGYNDVETREITGVAIDSRLVKKDFLFVPIKGARVDGHDFIPQVIEKGAMATLSEKKLHDAKYPYILVKDTQQALKDIAKFYREQLNIKIIGITGSVGKTSTKEMVSSVLSEKFNVLKTAGNFNNEIGLPLTIFNIHSWHEIAVLEMGISDFGEMTRLSKMSQPDIQLITNIGVCHLENLKTRDGILQAKTECFENMQDNGVIILNGDDDKLSTKSEVAGKKVVFYGEGKLPKTDESGNKYAVYATNSVNKGFEGMYTTINTEKGSFDVQINIPGEHNIYNALAATAVGLEVGLSLDEIKSGISKAETIAGRTNFIKTNTGMIVIDDCYNANPASMKTSLEVLSHATNRSVAVIGDMGELGSDEVNLHKIVGKSAADNNIDVVFAVGELAKNYISEIEKSGKNIKTYYYKTTDELAVDIKKYVKETDTILVKASHFMKFEKIVEVLKNM